MVKDLESSDERWGCFVCDTPSGLKEMQKQFSETCTAKDDKTVEELLGDLNEYEDAVEEALDMLEHKRLEEQKVEFYKELNNEMEVEKEMELYIKLWKDHHTRLIEILPSIQ